MKQKAWSFDTVTLIKIGKSALLVLGGTALTFLADNLLQIVGAFNLEKDWAVILVGFMTWLINTVREYIKGS